MVAVAPAVTAVPNATGIATGMEVRPVKRTPEQTTIIRRAVTEMNILEVLFIVMIIGCGGHCLFKVVSNILHRRRHPGENGSVNGKGRSDDNGCH